MTDFKKIRPATRCCTVQMTQFVKCEYLKPNEHEPIEIFSLALNVEINKIANERVEKCHAIYLSRVFDKWWRDSCHSISQIDKWTIYFISINWRSLRKFQQWQNHRKDGQFTLIALNFYYEWNDETNNKPKPVWVVLCVCVWLQIRTFLHTPHTITLYIKSKHKTRASSYKLFWQQMHQQVNCQ